MFAFTHLVFAWLIGKGYEKIAQKELSNTAWLLLLLGSLISDADFLFDWALGTEVHRTLTHSLLFVIGGAVIVYFIFLVRKSPEAKTLAFAFGVGICTHLFLDMFLSQGAPLFWPSLLHFSFQGIGYFDPATPSFLNLGHEHLRRAMKIAIVDMALGTAWIFWLVWRRKVKL